MSITEREVAAPAAHAGPTGDPEPPEPAEDEQRVVLGGIDGPGAAELAGAGAAGLGLGYLLYHVLLPGSSSVGYWVTSYLCFLGVLAVLVGLSHGKVVLVDRMLGVAVTSGAVFVMAALASSLLFVLGRGLPALQHLNFYTEDLRNAGPLDPLSVGGVVHALVGTLVIIGVALVITLPLGILCALYLTEVGGPMAQVVRSVVEAMTALPSIVAGLFIYIVWVQRFGLSGFAAALAVSVMMLPIIARSAEVVLRLVPGGLREASLALGASQLRTVWSVVLPTARPTLATAMVLGIARGIGETSPVLVTAGFSNFVNVNPFSGPMTPLPLLVYSLSRSPEEAFVSRAFAAAAFLLIVVFLLFFTIRLLVGRRASGH